MPWVNPLDKVPQIPQDWANHIVYGGVAGTAMCLVMPRVTALAIVFAVSAAKKVVDYFKENESAAMCIGKALVSCVWTASLLIGDYR